MVAVFALVGAAVAGARPDNAIGWLFLAGGLAWGWGDTLVDVAHLGLVTHPGTVPGATALALAGSSLRGAGWVSVTLGIAVLFPTGRVAGPGWRWLGRTFVVVLVAAVVAPFADPQGQLVGMGAWHNPLAPTGGWRWVTVVTFLLSLPLGVLAVVAAVVQLVYRARRANAQIRAQLLLVAMFAVLPALVPLVLLSGLAGAWAFSAAIIPLTLAIGYAVVTGDLYRLRDAAHRSLVWGTMSAALIGTYAVIVVGVSAMMDVRGASWVSWLAAAGVAVAFAPLRDALQRGAGRLVYGRWHEPYAVLADLARRLSAATDTERLLVDVLRDLDALGLRDVEIARGSVADPDKVSVALSAYGQQLGTLQYRPPAPGLRPRDQQLLDDLATQLGGLLHAEALSRQLQIAIEKTVLAREEERRRLRRDLHDGLGPELAGHLLRLDVLAEELAGSPVSGDLDALRAGMRETVVDVRRIVSGLRPPALDDLGLEGAIGRVVSRLTSGSALDVQVQSDLRCDLPAAIEVAAYRIVSEALTNVVRHAAASACEIRLTVHEVELCIEVSDNGIGSAAVEHGSLVPGNGLDTMRERADELGGQFEIKLRQGGTRIVARLPLGQSLAAPTEGS